MATSNECMCQLVLSESKLNTQLCQNSSLQPREFERLS